MLMGTKFLTKSLEEKFLKCVPNKKAKITNVLKETREVSEALGDFFLFCKVLYLTDITETA